MPSALILIADGTEEIEFVTPYDVLTRAGFKVKSAGVDLKHDYADCSRRVKITPDYPSIHPIASDNSSDHHDADILVLPGGAAGAQTFSSNAETLALIRRFRDEGKWVGAICAGTTALVRSAEEGRNLSGKTEMESGRRARVTSHPSVKEEVQKAGWEYADEKERVVVDGKMITSRGPGTAMLFALTIVEQLAGKDKKEEVMGPMMCAESL